MIKVMELFGGIGACTQAMKRLEIDFEVVDYVEIDKYAVKSYNAINSTNYEPQDITKWDKDIKADFIMSGSPCQDFSVAGLGKGGDEGSGTRSSLMYENVRIIDKVRPKYVLWENVKNVLSKKHRHNFDNYLSKMEELGYHNYYQVLNAKDFGVPQNRERIFVLSCLEDIDYKFPQKQELAIRLKDILEDEVDEKYYISSDKVEKLVKQIVAKGDLGKITKHCTIREQTGTFGGNYVSPKDVSTGICSRDYKGPVLVVEDIEKVLLDDTNSEQFGNCRLYKDNAPSLRSQRQGQKVVEIEPLIIGGEQKNQAIKADGVCTCLTSSMGCGGGYVPLKAEIEQVGNIVSTGNFENPQRGRIYSSDGICPALNCMRGGGLEPKIIECEKIGYFPYPNSNKCHQSNTVYSPNGLCPTIDCMGGGNTEPKIIEVHQLGNINPSGHGQNGSVVSDQGLARTVTVEKGEGQKILEVCKINENRHSSTMNSVLDTNGICSCLDTMGGGNREPKVVQVLPILTPDRLEKRQNGRRCKDDGEPMFTLTGQDRHGVIVVEVPTEVEVRKYDVDVEKLKVILIDAKKNSGLTINQISKEINVSKTKVEHWFRKDDCFSIPDKEVWFGLKELLNISTDEFDLPVTEFIVKENTYDMANRFYHVNGIAPTLTCGIVPNIIGNAYVIYIRKLTPKECWRLMGFTDDVFKLAEEVNSNSQLYKQAGNSIVVDVLVQILGQLRLNEV